MHAVRMIIPALAIAAMPVAAHAGLLAVVDTQPPAHDLVALPGTEIAVQFDRPVDPKTVTPDSFWAFARWSGTVTGDFSFADGGTRVILSPDRVLSSGEMVTVYLSHDLRGTDGTPLRNAGFSFQFWTRARPTPAEMAAYDQLSTNLGFESSRPYGGIGSDLNGDGWLDLTAVNEDTDDIRVFLNTGNGLGSYGDIVEPTAGSGNVPSPSEPADFNRDGHTDVCLANTADSSVSVLLGNGDGTFGTHQEIEVGDGPRGIAVLDVDGDGDTDIVTANAGPGTLSVMINDGSGVFGPASSFEGGGSGEWALASADMNGDGILDLVVGARNSQQIIVQLGDGDGTFTFSSSRASGGQSWMLVVGDINGDGTEDVAVANSSNDNGGILLGDGAGGISPVQTYGMDSFPLATDLGDIDGDGDLDWLSSSFGGDWTLYTNDGDGTFTFDREFPAPVAASCAVMLDTDNDGDLDLALIDELADTIDLVRNSGTAVVADLNGDDAVDVQDLLMLLGAWGPCPAPCLPVCPSDLNLDCEVTTSDLLMLLGQWGP